MSRAPWGALPLVPGRKRLFSPQVAPEGLEDEVGVGCGTGLERDSEGSLTSLPRLGRECDKDGAMRYALFLILFTNEETKVRRLNNSKTLSS